MPNHGTLTTKSWQQQFAISVTRPYHAQQQSHPQYSLGIPSPFVVSIDRTDWYLGETPLNILMLSLIHQGVAFPLLWTVLEKKVCSDTTERIALLEKYLKLFGKDSLSFVTADREFIGRDWFRYLRREKIPFRLRIRENLKVTTARGHKKVFARSLFRTQRAGVGVLLRGERKVLGKMFP